jgi:hypothetical protein
MMIEVVEMGGICSAHGNVQNAFKIWFRKSEMVDSWMVVKLIKIRRESADWIDMTANVQRPVLVN